MSDSEKEPLISLSSSTDLAPEDAEPLAEYTSEPLAEYTTEQPAEQPARITAEPVPQNNGEAPLTGQTLPRTNRRHSVLFEEQGDTLPKRQMSDEKTRILDQSFGGTTCYGGNT